MKLDKSVIERRRKLMEEEGVVFKTGVDVGNGASFKKITDEFDAVALCCGSKKARSITAKGSEECKDMYFAVDFLKSATKDLLSGKAGKWTISAKDKNVVVVGGGDTGNDCVGTCIRVEPASEIVKRFKTGAMSYGSISKEAPFGCERRSVTVNVA